VLTPHALRERLQARLSVLTGGPRDLPARQQTLRATVEWSHGLLEPDAQRAFAALAVFRGGWTIGDAEAICDADLDSVASLVDHNLVSHRGRSVPGDELVMLETIREVAEERLDADPELGSAVRRRHAEWIARLAEASHLTSTKAVRREVLEPDWDGVLAVRDDVRAALDWAVESDPVLAGGIVVSLEQLWVTHGVGEGRARAEMLLETGSLPTPLRAALYRVHGGVATVAGDVDVAVRSYERALALFRELGAEEDVVAMLTRFAIHASYERDAARTRQLVADVRASGVMADVPGIEAQCLSALAGVAMLEDDRAAALDLQRRAVSTARACGFRLWEGWGAAWVAQREFDSNLLDEATESARAALVFARRVGDLRVTVTALVLLSAIAYRRGSHELAGRLWGAVVRDEAHLRVVEADLDLVAVVERLREADERAFVVAASSKLEHLTLEQAAALTLRPDGLVPA
jgi:hypothetical protein